MRITSVAGTDLFGGSAQHPLQIVRVAVLDDRPPQGAPPLAGPARWGGPPSPPLQSVGAGVPADRPPQGAPPLAVTVRVEGPGVSTPVPVRLDLGTPGTEPVAEVGVHIAAPAVPGSPRQVTAI